MTSFNASVPLWDLSGTYPHVSDDDFLALLQKDLASSLSAADTSLLANPSPLSTIPPAQLTSFQAPVTGPSTPPLTDDSSPSPSSSSIPEPQSATEPSNTSRTRRQSTTASRRTSLAIPAAVAAATHDSPDSLKRKASTADLNPATGRKVSLSESNSNPKTPASGPARTKPPKDETRLMRRKEQNRAAQRAFRERKERHVHELEERVAELEAASEAKDQENENLRDLLGRLQEENQNLKSGASANAAPSSASFSFSMPPPSSIPSQSQSQQQQSQQQTQNQAPPLLHHTSSSSSSGIGSPWPPATGVQTPQLVANSPPLDTASLTGMNNMNFTMMDGDVNSSGDIDWSALTTLDPAALNMLDADINMMDFSSDGMDSSLFGSSPSSSDANGNGNGMAGGFRTIASNPMFMSFAEPFSAWDAMSQSNVAGQNQGQSLGATAGSALSRGSSGSSNWEMNMFNSFGSWSGYPSSQSSQQGQSQQQQQQQQQNWNGQQQQNNQGQGQTHPHSQPPSHQNSLDELLNLAGMSTNGNNNTTSPGAQQHGGMRSILGLGSEPVSSPNGTAGSLSPSQHAIDASATNATNGGACPRTKADFAAKIANDMASPFGPQTSSTQVPHGMSEAAMTQRLRNDVISPFNTGSASASSSSLSNMTSPSGSAVSPREPGGGSGNLSRENNGSVSCTGSVFPTTEKSEANIEVLAAWRRITSDPQFKNVDINELCAEFTNKAKCDGTKVVLDPAGVSSIIQKFTGRT